jgi:hypothetical protein
VNSVVVLMKKIWVMKSFIAYTANAFRDILIILINGPLAEAYPISICLFTE